MARCTKCEEKRGVFELTNGVCKSCIEQEKQKKILEEQEKARIAEKQEAESLSNLLVTTETSLNNIEVKKRIDIISAECVIGMNIFKDLLSGITDIVGGHSKSMQNTLKKAKEEVISELKKEAVRIGANAIVAIDLDYSEISGGGKSMLFIVATGTAVVI